jgi:hypothetical protein
MMTGMAANALNSRASTSTKPCDDPAPRVKEMRAAQSGGSDVRNGSYLGRLLERRALRLLALAQAFADSLMARLAIEPSSFTL